ncbi:hypothetical protein SAMN05421759_102558 [Roseivivax lentus]|uniref:Polymer-forming cytoskeletal protein n=1 Tax=Roseivivax lentus TaxID=633194 RepID=A0A1N7LBV2_9RHOB|nr:hypothetical protein [Roseivivax lentus]SIS71277.1 hypothetical protein SAMN05421759_102558 [Roseivivax lentus]
MPRIFTCLFTIFLALPALPALAQDTEALLDFGGDVFRAGRDVVYDGSDADDLFMAGETVAARGAIAGSAYLAGREVRVAGDVGGDVFAAGDSVTLEGTVTGDATLAGRAVSVRALGGDLRVMGSEVTLLGDIAGYAMIAGEDIRIEGVVAGDVRLTGERVEWGPDARIDGQLVLYEERPGSIAVPEGIPVERIERRDIAEWEGIEAPSWGEVILSFLMGVLVITAIAALIAALVPKRLAEMRRQVLARPFFTLWSGFLVQSALIGSGIILAMTLIGLLLLPAIVAVALAAGFAGYVVAAYSFGVGLLLAFGRDEPGSIGARALAGAVGALAAGLLGLIPFFGWIFVLALVLTGIGAITNRIFRPAFFSKDSSIPVG